MLPNIQLFLDHLASQTPYTIIDDARGVAPGGPIQLDITNDRKTIASLVIKTMNPIGVAPDDLANYVITDITIDNATVLKPSHSDTADSLCNRIEETVRRPYLSPRLPRQHRAAGALSTSQTYGRHFEIKHRCKFVAVPPYHMTS